MTTHPTVEAIRKRRADGDVNLWQLIRDVEALLALLSKAPTQERRSGLKDRRPEPCSDADGDKGEREGGYGRRRSDCDATAQGQITREEINQILRKRIRIDDDSEEWESPQPRIVGTNEATDDIYALVQRLQGGQEVVTRSNLIAFVKENMAPDDWFADKSALELWTGQVATAFLTTFSITRKG